MDIRFVEEREPVRQELLEIDIASVLKRPFNDFETRPTQGVRCEEQAMR